MHKRTSSMQWVLAAFALAASCASSAQQAPSAPASSPPTPAAPAPRESPRPDQLEPGVNTSAPVEKASTPSPASVPAKAAPSEASASATSPKTAPKGPPAPAAPKSGASGKAQDRIELDTTQITGNRELPKVLYIVPWKRSDLGDLVGKPVNSLLDEVLAPVDRDVFRRENRYYEALKPDQGGGAAAGAGAPAGSGEKH